MERRRQSSELPKRSSTREKAMKDLATAAATAAMDDEGDLDDDEDVAPSFPEDDKKRRLSPSSAPAASAAVRRTLGGGGGGAPPSQPCCQAEKCTADLTEAKRYHRRHKVCEAHSKAAVVVVAGLRQRFCQQCSRFHELSEFDDAKRSCRRRLAGHNERRRKSSSETAQGEGSSHCRHPDGQDGRIQMSLPGSSPYKHFQIR